MTSTTYNRHEAYYAIEKQIENSVKALSDADLHFAYWLNYEPAEAGFLEETIRREYSRRKLDNAQIIKE